METQSGGRFSFQLLCSGHTRQKLERIVGQVSLRVQHYFRPLVKNEEKSELIKTTSLLIKLSRVVE